MGKVAMPDLLEALHLRPATAPVGLVPVTSMEELDHIEEASAVRQAAALGDIDYVLFRRFVDGRSSQAAACVIDNCDGHLDRLAIASLHKKLWLTGLSPLLYVSWPTHVDILSCARGADFWDGNAVQYEPADTLAVTQLVSSELDDRLRRYSAYRLSDGTFWDDAENTALAKIDKAAHRQLIRAVIEVDRAIEGDSHPVLRRLLLLTILIKYLEDRGVFPENWFARFVPGATSFFSLLQMGTPEHLRTLLVELENKFNGDVFELPDEKAEDLTSDDLRRFADLVEAKTLQNQRYLWEQYSFRYIPVEVLSHLYQHFAQQGKGAVFTPPLLASLLLDQVMPYTRITGNERILDPTCGSGIFLVGAFRRLVQHWQSSRAWQQPTVSTLKSILKQSIFGVELQAEAIHLTAFSLALAMCDALQPNVIWHELRFDKLLGTNLHAEDFADWLTKARNPSENKYDIVVGNPPFLSKLGKSARQYRKLQRRETKVPDNQMAYFILEESVTLLNDGGRLCLIQPNGFLSNENARRFQRHFIQNYGVESILDFASIRRLYDGADPKTIAIVCSNRPSDSDDSILHFTFRRTFSVNQRISFELDHYDRHVVSRKEALQFSWIWRVNLLGGGRLKHLAARLNNEPTLAEFVHHKAWDYGEGFVTAKSGALEKAPWLTGKPFLPTSAFHDNGIDSSKLALVEADKFRSSYSETRYSGPLMLIKEIDTLPCAFWEDGFLAYRHRIVGIHAPEAERSELRDLFETFRSNRTLLSALCSVYGSEALSGKATSILKRDIDVLPWPEAPDRWNLSWWEEVLCNDVVSWMVEFVRRGQNSPLLRQTVTSDALREYSEVFVRMLGSVYENLQPAQSGVLGGIAYQAFSFGASSIPDWPEDWSQTLQDVIYRDNGDAMRTARILRFYDQNTLVLVKPDRLRYWLSSTAIHDADETLVDLQQQGY